MKVAVTASKPTLDDQVDPRFGRCAYFLIVETDTMDFVSLENPNIALGGGAGIQSAQLMSEHDVKFALTGNCGPNAFQTLEAAGIQVIVGVSGVVRQVIEQLKSGAFSTVANPNVASHFGMGTGGDAGTAGSTQPLAQQMGGSMGMGRGMGGGRGMGRGMGKRMGMGGGMGRGMSTGMGGGMGGVAPPPKITGESETESLKVQAQALAEQLRIINTQISQAEQRAALPRLVAVVDSDKCNACGICQKVCPTAAITLNKTAQIDTSKCNGCGRCIAECPQSAISLYNAE
jgi:predicted Fe-Mo cluster-binding NifX family protein/ferredoxin